MAHFEDLTPSSYGGGEQDENVLNVGWFSANESFRKGELTERFILELSKLVEEPVNLYRGVHYCEFCPPPEFEKIPDRIISRVVKYCPNGNGEIRVNGRSGIIYVAPVLIYHYVKEHGYLPPKEFVNAVLRKNA